MERLLIAAHTLYIPSALLLPEDPERFQTGLISRTEAEDAGSARIARAADSSARLQLCFVSQRGGGQMGTGGANRQTILTSPEQRLAPEILRSLLDRYRRLHHPRVSIVSILDRKAAELPAVLESYFGQTYEGEIEVVFVDDASPDPSSAVAQSVSETLRQRFTRPLSCLSCTMIATAATASPAIAESLPRRGHSRHHRCGLRRQS